MPLLIIDRPAGAICHHWQRHDPWIGYVLDGSKTWEMRSSKTSDSLRRKLLPARRTFFQIDVLGLDFRAGEQRAWDVEAERLGLGSLEVDN
jgi:hypothetical protein